MQNSVRKQNAPTERETTVFLLLGAMSAHGTASRKCCRRSGRERWWGGGGHGTWVCCCLQLAAQIGRSPFTGAGGGWQPLMSPRESNSRLNHTNTAAARAHTLGSPNLRTTRPPPGRSFCRNTGRANPDGITMPDVRFAAVTPEPVAEECGASAAIVDGLGRSRNTLPHMKWLSVMASTSSIERLPWRST